MNFHPIAEYMEQVLVKEKRVPGCDVLICRDHETLFRYSCGVRNYAATEPVRQDDLYHLYSCTKPITCTAAMQLVEQGLMDLDAPAESYLPEMKDVFLLKDGQPVPPQNKITVRHLFTMSAGFDYNFRHPSIMDMAVSNPDATTRDIVSTLFRRPLKFEPGTQFEYSMCHDILAVLVEVVSGKRFSRYLKDHIFDPLGMIDTGFHLSSSLRPRMAAQYRCPKAQTLTPIPQRNDFELTENYESGGAGLYSTVQDYSLFADAMACGGTGKSGAQILKPETIDLMRTEQLRSFAVNSEFTCAAGAGYGYGLGVRTLVDRSEGQRSSLGEFGWDGAAGSYLMVDPTYRLSIVFSMHVNNWPALIGCGHAPIRDMTYDILGL